MTNQADDQTGAKRATQTPGPATMTTESRITVRHRPIGAVFSESPTPLDRSPAASSPRDITSPPCTFAASFTLPTATPGHCRTNNAGLNASFVRNLGPPPAHQYERIQGTAPQNPKWRRPRRPALTTPDRARPAPQRDVSPRVWVNEGRAHTECFLPAKSSEHLGALRQAHHSDQSWGRFPVFCVGPPARAIQTLLLSEGRVRGTRRRLPRGFDTAPTAPTSILSQAFPPDVQERSVPYSQRGFGRKLSSIPTVPQLGDNLVLSLQAARAHADQQTLVRREKTSARTPQETLWTPSYPALLADAPAASTKPPPTLSPVYQETSRCLQTTPRTIRKFLQVARTRATSESREATRTP